LLRWIVTGSVSNRLSLWLVWYGCGQFDWWVGK